MDEALAVARAEWRARQVADPVARETAAEVARTRTEELVAETLPTTVHRITEALLPSEVERAYKASPPPAGQDGTNGSPGTNGTNGSNGSNGLGITWRGAWRKNATYAVNDACSRNGSAWIAISPSKGQEPPGKAWNLMAAKGEDGKPGAKLLYNAGGSGGGSGTGALTILDEGTPVGVATSLDFQGAGVSVGAPSGGVVPVVVSGGGLPPQWTDGGDGNVTATVDDVLETPLTIIGTAGQLKPELVVQAVVGQDNDNPIVLVKDENGNGMWLVNQDVGADGAATIFGLGPTVATGAPDVGVLTQIDNATGVNNFWEAFVALVVDVPNDTVFNRGIVLDVFKDALTPANSYANIIVTARVSQTSPLLKLRDEAGVTHTAIGPNGELGFFGVTPAAQPAAPSTLNEVIAALQALGLVGT